MMGARESHNPKYGRNLESKLGSRGCREYREGYYSELRAIPCYRTFEYT